MTDLKALDAAATQGVWYRSGTGHLCARELHDGSRRVLAGSDADATFADAKLAAALVNAYRAGELVPRQTAPEAPMTDPQRDPAPTLAAVMRLAQRGIVAEDQGGIWYVDGHPPMTTEAMVALSEGGGWRRCEVSCGAGDSVENEAMTELIFRCADRFCSDWRFAAKVLAASAFFGVIHALTLWALKLTFG